MPSDLLPFPPADPVAMLTHVRLRMTQREIADRLSVDPKTVSRWERRKTSCPIYVQAALREMLPVAAPADAGSSAFTFVDLFAGIGCMRLGFELAGGSCVFTSEWNPSANKTYVENFGSGHPLVGDIVQQDEQEIPDHDVLLAGFPCQPLSIAAVSKKNAFG